MPKVVPEYKEEAKARILSAATQTFAERGYHGATMDDVARVIGVSKGAVYVYFKNKEELFQEMCRRCTEDLERNLNASFAGGTFFQAASVYFDKAMSDLAAHMFWLESLAEMPRNPSVKRMLQESYVRYNEILVRFLDRLKVEGAVGKDVDNRSLAGVLMALHDGVVAGMAQGLNESEAKKVWSDGAKLLLQGTVGHSSTNGRNG